ncbi:MAG TPA: ribosomal protein S18-alanine N-acetyltransferase, partial [Gemmatimonadota bacterium]|nr:ribosomal protein S18-alanine N-acetyltransferase [Gemmatimonadota bacterium]
MASEAPPTGAAVVVRRAREVDLRAVVAIERASFAVPWSERAFRAVLGRRDAVLVVAEKEGSIVGHAAAWFAADEGELADLAVALPCRGRGVGRRLLEAVRSLAVRRGVRDLYLQVRESNEAARRLYASAGFEPVGRHR